MSMSASSADKLLGKIVQRSKQIESLLKQFGAQGRGIHELTGNCASRLPSATVKQLRFIATIRNKAVHEENFAIKTNYQAFVRACDEVTCSLKQIAKPKNEEHFLAILALLPGPNIFYFFYLIYKVLSPLFIVAALIFFWLAATAIIVLGVLWKKPFMLIFGMAVFVGDYLAGLFFVDLKNEKYASVLVLNIIALVKMFYHVANWPLAGVAIVLTFCWLASFAIWYLGFLLPGATLFLLVYFAGIITAWLRKK